MDERTRFSVALFVRDVLSMWIFLITTILAFVILKSWRSWQHRKVIQRWKTALSLDQHYPVYQALFSTVNGFSLSKEARRRQDYLDYVYGEIEFDSFIALISLCHPNQSTVFYDLGSGIGKPVIACAMVFDIKQSCGIEILTLLHQAADQQRQQLAYHPDYTEKANRIKFENKNLLDAELRDATLVFINATAFLGETWFLISERLQCLQPNSLVITTTKPLKSSEFTLLKKVPTTMSWGIVNAFIQKRD